MKKFILPVLLFLMFIPFYVNAETCDTDKITISSITMENKSDNVEELEAATVSGKNINLNLFMSNVGDTIKYKITIKNDSNEDYLFDKNSFNIESDYINYSLESSNNSNIVKKKSSKTMYLNIQYRNEVPSELLESGSYNDNKNMKVILSTGDIIKNPKTGVHFYALFLIIILIVSTLLYMFLKKKKYVKYMILLIGTAIILPVSVYALCKCEIIVSSNITIGNEIPCHYNGNLIQGAEYVYGQYTYRYMQKREYVEVEPGSFGLGWVNSDQDGWAVILTDLDSTAPVTTNICRSINGKNVVNMHGLFSGSQAEAIDLSSFTNLHVTDMAEMFSWTAVKHLDLTHLDTSDVEKMSQMFQSAEAEELDISSFNTSKVTDMLGMFAQAKAITINVSGIDTSKVTDMSYMFQLSEALVLDLSDFNTSKVTNMTTMFANSKATTLNLSSFDTSNVTDFSFMFQSSNVTTLNLGNFNTSKATNMYRMFTYSKATTIDLSNFDTSNVTDTRSMFESSEATTLDLSSFNLSNVQQKEKMFRYCKATIGYARTQEDANILNNGTNKPVALNFVVKGN